MRYVRIRSYMGKQFTGCEQLYPGNDQVKAIVRFREAYPEHKDCVLVAEPYNSNDPKNAEHFAACLRCGCVN